MKLKYKSNVTECIGKALKDSIRCIERKCHNALEDISVKKSTPKLLLAVSGGKDSVGLFHYFQKEDIYKEYKIYVAYINHRMQELAAQEKEFSTVFTLTQEAFVPLYSVSVIDIPKTEEEARNVRYKCLSAIAGFLDISYIVTAHHLYDQFETVMMRLLDGRGRRGLSGIPRFSVLSKKYQEKNKNNQYVLRPALTLTPAELHKHVTIFHTDKSNSATKYKRNQFRKTVFPAVQNMFLQADGHVAKFSQMQERINADKKTLQHYWMRCLNGIWFSRKIFESLCFEQKVNMLYDGANILGISYIKYSFIEDYIKKISFLKGRRCTSVNDCVILCTKRKILWGKKSETKRLLESDNKRHYLMSNKHYFVLYDIIYCTLVRLKKELRIHAGWRINKYPSCKILCGITYCMVIEGEAYVTLPTKHDCIKVNSHSINIRAALLSSGVNEWNIVPIIRDLKGVVFVAGETLLGRSLVSDRHRKDDVQNFSYERGDSEYSAKKEKKICFVTVTYNKLLIELKNNLV